MSVLVGLAGYFGLICSLCRINNDVNNYQRTHNRDMLPVIYAECVPLVAWVTIIIVVIVKG